MKIIATNDDGIEAPGLQALYESLQEFGEITVAAPSRPQSGVAHRVTTHTPIGITQVGRNRYSIDGTPADCTRLALKHFAPDAAWVIAGINAGANLGSDVYQSGTVAAAREAAILGYPAIAVSQYIARDHALDWALTRKHAIPVLKDLMGKALAPGHFWNVNLPHPLDLHGSVTCQFCGLDTHPHLYEYHRNAEGYLYQGSIHDRPRDPGKDVAVCFDQGQVSITRIALRTTKLDEGP